MFGLLGLGFFSSVWKECGGLVRYFGMKAVSVKTPSLCPRLGISGGSAEHREGLNSCVLETAWHRAVSPQLR